MTVATDIDRRCLDTIRSFRRLRPEGELGSPRPPMGAAPMAYSCGPFLRHAPTRPDWPDRDRFVLSAGQRACSCTRSSISPATRSRWRISSRSASGLDHARASRIRPDPASRRRPGRLARASRTPWGWRSRNSDWPSSSTSRSTRSSITDLRQSPPTATLQKASPRSRPAWPAPAAGADRAVRRQPRPARRADVDGPGPRKCQSASRRTAAWPPRRRRHRPGGDRSRHRDGARRRSPELIAVRTHIGYGSPNRQDTQKAHGQALGPTRCA